MSLGSSLTAVQRTTNWQTTNKENLCVASNLNTFEAKWNIDPSILSDLKSVHSVTVKFDYEGLPVETTFKPKNVTAAAPLLTT
jgi:hypothetical protein